MIEEYARHNGHADLIRELVDGADGLVSTRSESRAGCRSFALLPVYRRVASQSPGLFQPTPLLPCTPCPAR